MEAQTEKEKTIFDFIPKILPLIDLMLIVLVAFTSPDPWITTPIHLALPVIGILTIRFFQNKGQLGFYVIGASASVPIFALNLWCSPTCPTWLNGFAFIIGGLMLSRTLADALVVLGFLLVSTIVPLYLSGNNANLIMTVLVAELIVWFMMERCMKFMNLQKRKVEEQKKMIEEKNKDILDSIRYARRIQRSLLPSEKYISRALKKDKEA